MISRTDGSFSRSSLASGVGGRFTEGLLFYITIKYTNQKERKKASAKEKKNKLKWYRKKWGDDSHVILKLQAKEMKKFCCVQIDPMVSLCWEKEKGECLGFYEDGESVGPKPDSLPQTTSFTWSVAHCPSFPPFAYPNPRPE